MWQLVRKSYNLRSVCNTLVQRSTW